MDGDDIDESEPRRIDHQLGHPNMGLIGLAVFSGQRIGKIRIEQDVNALAIAAEIRFVPATTGENCRRDWSEARMSAKQRVVGLDWTDHDRPSSLRTL